jgi:DNA-binding transcriptional ArsR family regulator
MNYISCIIFFLLMMVKWIFPDFFRWTFLRGSQAMANWTFITNHAAVLIYLAKNPIITARQMALEIGITERAVRTIIADLETEGYIEKAKEGRRIRYSVKVDLPLRHPTQRHLHVGKLLRVLGWTRKPIRKGPCKKS